MQWYLNIVNVDGGGKRHRGGGSSAKGEAERPSDKLKELLQTADDDNNKTNEGKRNDVQMKFRNYLPHDKQLQEGKVAPPVLPKFEDPIATLPPPEEKKEDPFLNIVPKKPNLGPLAGCAKKLEKLEKHHPSLLNLWVWSFSNVLLTSLATAAYGYPLFLICLAPSKLVTVVSHYIDGTFCVDPLFDSPPLWSAVFCQRDASLLVPLNPNNGQHL
ncbi:hypothetical protein HAX54_028857 [Datura stramonium]|uniref:Uncharacterized protein n=1 Tax=Datura stramonium TaxID=4076 RepID=A0ABS8V7P7_DATST|nr:hypothetical protein [Datura stramonium]